MKIKIFALSLILLSSSFLYANDDANSLESPEDEAQVTQVEKTERISTIKDGLSIVVKGGTEAKVDRHGRIIDAVLGEDAYLIPTGLTQPAHFKAGSKLHFNLEGKVTGGILASDYVYKSSRYGNGINFKEGKEIYFYENGLVRYGTLAKNADLLIAGSKKSVNFMRDKLVVFNSSMDVTEGYLGKKTKLAAMNSRGEKVTLEYPAGAPLKIDGDGNVTVPPPRKKKTDA